jgi:phage repressor protein C with HTH and peptisase S24 domain
VISQQEEFEVITKRLMAALGLGTEAALAELLGLSKSAYAMRKKRHALPRAEIDAACEAAKLSAAWVYEGRGEVRPGQAMKAVQNTSQAVQALSLDHTDARLLQELLLYVQMGDREKVLRIVKRLALVTVPRYDVAASAGSGAVVSVHDEAVVDMMAFRPEWLREIGVPTDRLAVISVRGDSMADTLQDGDLILVDTSLVERKMPGVYVIVKNDSLLVKRLNFKLNGSVEIRGDNKAYPAETLSVAEFEQLHLVGRMVRRVVR